MSNIFPPKLQPVLSELPDKNIIKPLDIISKSFDSFPPLKTPKIMTENKETIDYPAFYGIKIFKQKENIDQQKTKKTINFNYYTLFTLIIVILLIVYLRK